MKIKSISQNEKKIKIAKQFMPEFDLGRLCGMTCECVIALVTCVATIITTVIAVLSYLKDKKE